MAITLEVIQERQAAAAEFEAADVAAREAETRLANAKARLDAAHEKIAAEMQEGEILTLLPSAVPALLKKDGKVVVGVVNSIHPEAPVATP